MQVTIIDCGMGNLSSVAKAFGALNADVVVSSDPLDIERAERVVLPGVGSFGEGMKNLRDLGLIGPLEEQVLHRGKPFLGICLGMELLAQESSEDGYHEGLGWIPATVRPFAAEGTEFKSIHMGWNEVVPTGVGTLFAQLGKSPNFYFMHGYHVVCRDPRAVAAVSTYGERFVSAVQRGNILGVQFHPEKSQDVGLGLLSNFLHLGDTGTLDSESGSGGDGVEEVSGKLVLDPESHEGEGVVPKIRVVPTLSLYRGRLVKTVRFQLVSSGVRRDVGDLVKAPLVYDAQLADELVYLDIRASLEGRGVEELLRVVSEVAGQVFMPLTAGGGVGTVEEIRRLLKAGADKVAINTAAVLRPEFISEAARIFGRQCIVVAIDARRVGDRRYEVVTHSATRFPGLEVVRWAKEAAEAGAGEILVTSVDRDGTMEGYDLDLVQMVAEAVGVPVIASGGAGKLQDLVDGVVQGHASAVACASLYHFTDQSPIKAKAFLRRSSIPVRS